MPAVKLDEIKLLYFSQQNDSELGETNVVGGARVKKYFETLALEINVFIEFSVFILF